jgi:hypothetical protein
MRHGSIALPLAALASLALATVAVAGGWAQVSARNVPVDPPAGQQTTIDLRVLQHGVTPVSWPRLTIIASDATSGAVVRTQALAKGTEGSYVATIVFPSEGEWTLAFESKDLVMQGSVTMQVAPPVAAAPAGGGAAGQVAPAATGFDVMPLAFALLGAAVVVAIGGLVLRSRGALRGTHLSPRT